MSIPNIFYFDCVECKYNRDCYGGNWGETFNHCQKSAELLIKIRKFFEVQEDEWD